MRCEKKFSFALILIIITTVLLPQIAISSEKIWSISVKNIRMEKKERIVGFRVKLRAASIHSLPKVPEVWAIKIKNFLNDEPLWNTSLEAVVGVGAAALDPSFFQDFLVIEKYTGEYAEELELDIEVNISTTIDFETLKEKTFHMRDLILRPLPAE